MRGVWAALAVLGAGAALAPAGCSLLFDGHALLPADLAADGGSDDLGGIPGDDLAGAGCGAPVVFSGFGDLGAFDCPCGCTLDPFTSGPSPDRWTQAGTLGWTVAANDGTLQLAKADVSNGDSVQLTGGWQLEGDFDLRVDFLVAGVPNGGRGTLVAYGPAEMSAFVPTVVGLVYQQAGALRANLLVGDSFHDVGGAAAAGTLRIARKGALTCVEVTGLDTACRTVTMPRLHMYLAASMNDSACLLCGDIDVRFTKLRLASGRLVPP